MKTLYELLDVEVDATQSQIEQGYQRQLDRYLQRPITGRSEQETRRMQNIREAYLLLCSPPKRRIYDQQLRIFQQARKRVFNRANLWRAALVTLGVLVLGAGAYLRHQSRAEAWNSPGTAVAAVLSQVSQGDGRGGN